MVKFFFSRGPLANFLTFDEWWSVEGQILRLWTKSIRTKHADIIYSEWTMLDAFDLVRFESGKEW